VLHADNRSHFVKTGNLYSCRTDANRTLTIVRNGPFRVGGHVQLQVYITDTDGNPMNVTANGTYTGPTSMTSSSNVLPTFKVSFTYLLKAVVSLSVSGHACQIHSPAVLIQQPKLNCLINLVEHQFRDS
jgi:hypothetical protein